MYSAAPASDSQPSKLAAQLKELAATVDISDITDKQFDLLAKYCETLWDWNQKINLTRHTTPELFVQRDLVDSYKLAKQLAPDERVLDFGSGSGVPGIPVAILRPDVQMTLCDSVQKKARVLEDISKTLRVKTKVYGLNVKGILEEESFTSLSARAVGSISKMITWLQPYWHQFDRLLTIKGPSWVEERGEARHLGLLHGLQLRKLDEYPVVGHDATSVILQLRKE